MHGDPFGHPRRESRGIETGASNLLFYTSYHCTWLRWLCRRTPWWGRYAVEGACSGLPDIIRRVSGQFRDAIRHICTHPCVQIVLPGDRVAQLPAEGTVRVGGGVHQSGESLVATKAGVVRRGPSGALWVSAAQHRCADVLGGSLCWEKRRESGRAGHARWWTHDCSLSKRQRAVLTHLAGTSPLSTTQSWV